MEPEIIQMVTEVIQAKEAPKLVTEIFEKYVEEFSAEYKENPVFVRKSFVSKDDAKFEIEPGERAAIRWVSTIHLDRDCEILMPDGCRLAEFRKAPQVLWGHDYRMPPIGRDAWIKKWPKENPKGILAKTIYATTPMGEEIWTLVKGGFLRTSSVGFIPLKSVRNGEQGFDKLCDKIELSGLTLSDRSKIRRIYTDWLLLEHSDVSVPANINALNVAVGKGLELSEDLLKELGIDKDDVEAAKALETEREDTTVEEEETDPLKEFEEILKPFPNEHACRINEPAKYTSFARDNNKFGPGIHAIWGIKDGKSELQSIRFDKSKYPAAEAKKWATDHGYKCKPFEAAEPPKEGNSEVVKTVPVIEEVPAPPKPIVRQETVVEEIKTPKVIPIVESPRRTVEELVKEEVGRKLGKV